MEIITVIIPVYNAEAYLEECVKSVLSQTYPNINIILVDDGSTDGSSFICDRLSQIDSRIDVIHKSNEGVSAARNLGIKHSNGDYICFIDADDIIDVQMIEKLYKNMINNNTDLSICGHTTVISDGNNKRRVDHIPCLFCGTTKEFLKQVACFLDNESIQGPCAKLFKKKIIQNYRLLFPVNMEYGEDTFFVLSYISYTERISSISDIGYFYRKINSSSLSSKVDPNRIEIFIDLYELLNQIMIKYEVQDYSLIARRLCIAALACINELFSPDDIFDKSIRMSSITRILLKKEIVSSFRNQRKKNAKYYLIHRLLPNHLWVIGLLFSIKHQLRK